MRSLRPLLISAVATSSLAAAFLTGCGTQGPLGAVRQPLQSLQTKAQPHARALDARAERKVELLRAAYAHLDTLSATVSFWEQFGPDTSTSKVNLLMAKPTKIRADIIEADSFLKRGAKMVYLGDKKIMVKKAFVKKTYDYEDFTVRSLRGWRIDQSDFTAVVNSVLVDEARVKSIGTETVAGHPCDVFEVVSSALLPGTDREVVALDQQSSLPLKLEAYVGKDVVYRYELSDLKVNPTLPADAFTL